MASAMFFMVQKGAGPLKNLTEKARTNFAEAYLLSYLKGYLQTNAISAYWIGKMDLFMRYQMIDEYVAAQFVGSLFVIIHIPEFICNIIAGAAYLCLAYLLIKLFAKKI